MSDPYICLECDTTYPSRAAAQRCADDDARDAKQARKGRVDWADQYTNHGGFED